MKTAHLVAFLLGVACTLMAIQTFRPIEAKAQSKKKYYVYAVDDEGNVRPGIAGRISLSADGLAAALGHAGNNGYRVAFVCGTTTDGFTVIGEK